MDFITKLRVPNTNKRIVAEYSTPYGLTPEQYEEDNAFYLEVVTPPHYGCLIHVEAFLDEMLQRVKEEKNIVIVCYGSNGVVMKYAEEHGCAMITVPTPERAFGDKASYRRNEAMTHLLLQHDARNRAAIVFYDTCSYKEDEKNMLRHVAWLCENSNIQYRVLTCVPNAYLMETEQKQGFARAFDVNITASNA